MTNKTYADSSAVVYEYRPDGLLQTRTWARGIETAYGYATDGGLTNVNYSDATPDISYEFDRMNRIIRIADGIGTWTNVFNEDGTLASESAGGPGRPGTGILRFYDAFGRQTNLALNIAGVQAQNVAHGFDSAGRLFTVSDGMNTATYTYGPDGVSWTNLSFGSPMVTRRTFDGLNRLSTISSVASVTSVVYSASYSLNQANQRTTNALADGGKWVYQYDELGQVVSGKKYFPDGQPVQGAQFGYEFDTIGNRTSADNTYGSTNLQETYTANSLNQYTQRTVPGIIPVTGEADSNATVMVRLNTNIAVMANRHDEYFWKTLNVTNAAALFATTNLKVRAYKAVGTNSLVRTEIRSAIVPKTPETFIHDLDGNLVSDGLWTNYWSGENRLTQMVSLASVPDDQKKKLVFEYDYIGRRVSKTALSGYSGGNYSTTNSTVFIWTGWSLIGEIRNNQTTNWFTYGLDLSGTPGGAGDVGGLLFATLGTGTYSVAFDGNGNVMGLVDAAGSIAAEYQYGAFGECIEANGPAASENAVRFSTKYWDRETGFMYFGLRYINKGRFLSRDPVYETTPGNAYDYVRNNPISRCDLYGLLDFPTDNSYITSGGVNTKAKAPDPEYLEIAKGRRKNFSEAEFDIPDIADFSTLQLAHDATVQRDKEEASLYARMIKTCPEDNQVIKLQPAPFAQTEKGWRQKSCCTREACLRQAREFSSALAQFSVGVALAEYAKHGKVLSGNAGNWLHESIVGNPNRDSRINETKWREGYGQSCGAWSDNVLVKIESILQDPSIINSFCFRAMKVSKGKQFTRNWHEWWLLFGPNAFEGDISRRTLDNYRRGARRIVLDPWISGGLQIMPDSADEHESERTEQITQY